jgi:hypothetical protein
MSRFQPADLGDEDDDEITRQFLDQLRRTGYHGELEGLDEHLLRQIQLVRGSSNVQQVASKRTLQSLQSVKIEDLDESDRGEYRLTCNLRNSCLIRQLTKLKFASFATMNSVQRHPKA